MVLDQTKNNKQNKMKKRLIFRTIMLIVILAAVVFALIMNLTRDRGTIEKGDTAPDFELVQKNENNERDHIQLSESGDKGVVLYFWATYCKPCEEQFPLMETLHSTYKKDVEVLSINLDNSELVIQQFVNEHDLTIPVLHDVRNEVKGLYSASSIPSTFFINPEGEVVEKVVGKQSMEVLESYFKAIQSEDVK